MGYVYCNRLRNPPLATLICAAAGVQLFFSEGWACPNCLVGRAARVAVLGEGFFTHLFSLLAPAAVLGAIAALLYRIGRHRPRPNGTPGPAQNGAKS